MKNSIEFKVWGRYALFTDPITRIGGEKCSYHIPTYEALKGIVKSIYWKPTLIWYIDQVRVVRPIQMQSKAVKPILYDDASSNSLSNYTYLSHVEYQVLAHFEWNMYRTELAHDRVDGKHFSMAKRSLEKGGRQDIFLGTRECQGYVEPCGFGSGSGHYDQIDQLAYPIMFHSFSYPDESGTHELGAQLWQPVMRKGVVEFPRPEACTLRRVVRPMTPKVFSPETDFTPVDVEERRL